MAALAARPSSQPVPPLKATEPVPEPVAHAGAGRSVRLACRSNALTTPTAGLAPSHLQANLLFLPSRYASDFRLLCARNPVPCPLIAESAAPGSHDAVTSKLPSLPGRAVLSDVDLRRDAPRYNVYRDSVLAKSGCHDVVSEWTDDHVAFLIGCSFSFETALAEAGLAPRHSAYGRNVAMYRTAVPLCPAGVFTGATYVVSMRPYRAGDVERVRAITRAYHATHGEPLGWGWGALERLGIRNIDEPEWGDRPLTADGRPLGEARGDDDEVPMFWGCGVTPQEAVMRARLKGTIMSHAPGHMLVLDCKDSDLEIA
ncbi:hypothetical protein F4778DRAFT_768719 [Xylariomycetidae sp. FL2044]|nr:hypothetical protein F4778DRAFT_768719 [Xylariomycetidae sp. FL2044]